MDEPRSNGITLVTQAAYPSDLGFYAQGVGQAVGGHALALVIGRH